MSQALVLDAEPPWHGWPEVVDLDEPQKNLLPLRLLEVENDAELTAICAQKGSRLGLQRGRILPQCIARRRLNLDDLGAEVG